MDKTQADSPMIRNGVTLYSEKALRNEARSLRALIKKEMNRKDRESVTFYKGYELAFIENRLSLRVYFNRNFGIEFQSTAI